METVRRTIFEVLVLGVVAVGLALTANAVRASGTLKLTKNYFDKGFGSVDRRSPIAAWTDATATEAGASAHAERVMAPGDPKPVADRPIEHPYQQMSYEQVVAIFNDPNTELGVNIFVDARRDDAYEEGHIPGAIQADHFRLEEYIDNLLDHADGADKIIVYCNGGNCEDSIFLCGDLLEFEVPYENIYLFPGGWKLWTTNNMPVERGRDEGR